MIKGIRKYSLFTASLKKSFSDNLLNGSNVNYAESMYEKWIEDPNSVHSSWKTYFSAITAGTPSSQAFIHPDELIAKNISVNKLQINQTSKENNDLLHKISLLINEYRQCGHFAAKINPLNIESGLPLNPVETIKLSLEDIGISKEDFNKKINISILKAKELFGEIEEWTPLEIFNKLNSVYCGHIAFQYSHIPSAQTKEWIQKRIEHFPLINKSKNEKIELLDRILESQSFSIFCEKKYSTYKRFGCDGLDSGISGLSHLMNYSKKYGIKECFLGMAHRGRLNTLCSVLKKPYEQMFAEFEDIRYTEHKDLIFGFSGDVKYHLGCSGKLVHDNGKELIMNLLPNPSHLEAVYPVILGSTKARMRVLKDITGKQVLPVVIHGDAALAGQGIIYETQQMEKLESFYVGGTVHIVFNNQIGFTTDSKQSRSNYYPTSIAMTNGIFVIHANAQDPEAVDKAMELALDYRMEFGADVYLNIIGFRKFGHNEQDTPHFTQPQMYKAIKDKKSMYLEYSDKLIEEGVITKEEFDSKMENYFNNLVEKQKIAQSASFNTDEWDPYGWKIVRNRNRDITGVNSEKLKNLGREICKLPENFNSHKSIKKLYEDRLESIETGKGIDWGTAEALAFASLLSEGHSIRLSGEDVERGTFSHRHAVITDQKTNQKFMPLSNILKDINSKLNIHNSLLSEYGVLGFEYGHSIANPDDLTIWEAQFGDFANGAQIIIDQFITSGEKKWGKQSGLVCYLPHGADGQGPEHSNCHIERLLSNVSDDWRLLKSNPKLIDTLSKDINMFVVNVTAPSNLFHLLRWQLKANYRKPLIFCSPKRLLRHKLVRSDIEEFEIGSNFEKVIGEKFLDNKNKIRKVLTCSGQIYFDLLEKREALGIEDVAIIRLEQLGPFPYLAFEKEINEYKKDVEVTWVSEEPENFGAWFYVKPRMDLSLEKLNRKPLNYVGRPISTATASGYSSLNKKELNQLLKEAFD